MSNSTGSNQTPFNLSRQLFEKQAANTPEAIALEIIGSPLATLPKTIWTYTELDETIRSIAAGLKDLAATHNIAPGEFLLLRLNSNASFAFSFFGAIAAGFVPIPLSPHLSQEEVAFYIKDTGVKWAIQSSNLNLPEDSNLLSLSEEDLLSYIDNVPPGDYHETDAEDPAYLIYTSGTTSTPKGVLHAQRAVLGRAPMVKGWHDISAGDRILHAGDYNWTYTLGVGLMDPWARGATALIYHGEKSPTIWPQLIEAHKVTIFAAVPGVYRQILKYAPPTKQQLTTLRHCLSAGEALSSELRVKWQEHTGTPIYEALGQSEISTYVSTAPNIEVPKTAKGCIQKGRKVSILCAEDKTNLEPLDANQNGLIAVHETEKGLMLSYWQRPVEQQAQFRGPWFITGDLGSIDEQGNLTHTGRKDDLMNASGYRVSPDEVEKALTQSKTVSEAAVFEQRINQDLSIITAMIVKNEDSSLDDEALTEQLKLFVANKLAPYKQPKNYVFIDKLPKNKAGKLLRKDLQSLIK